MKKSSASKELLVDWLRTALDYKLYPGLGWSNRNEEIFYVKWVHKSSESWSGDDLAPFKAWAAHKGKLDGKNPKQLKATFRCALNSKKELKEHHRDRERRYWQFVDPNSVEKDKMPKKRRKNKNSASRVDGAITVAYNNDVKRTNDNSLFLNENRSKHENETLNPAKLPAFNSFNFQPLTPPDQGNESCYIGPDIKYSKDNIIKLENCDTNLRDVNHIPPSVSPFSVNNFIENASEEYKPNYTPPPDQNRLTPPQKPYITRDSFNHSSTEMWQPNCFPVHNEDKEPKVLSEFFSSDFIGLYKSSTQESENNNCMDFLDMDQYVPVTNTSINLQTHNKNGQSTLFNRSLSSNQIQTDHSLEKFDDFFLGDDVDLEVCRKLVQEMDRTYRLQM